MALSVGVFAEDDPTVEHLADALTEAGHVVSARATVVDEEPFVARHLPPWIANEAIHVVVGPRTAATRAALIPLITKRMLGFSDLRDVDGGRCDGTIVVLVPATTELARAALARALPRIEHELARTGGRSAKVTIPPPRPGHITTPPPRSGRASTPPPRPGHVTTPPPRIPSTPSPRTVSTPPPRTVSTPSPRMVSTPPRIASTSPPRIPSTPPPRTGASTAKPPPVPPARAAAKPPPTPAKVDSAQAESSKVESATVESAKSEPAKCEPASAEAASPEVTSTEPASSEPARSELTSTEPASTEPASPEPASFEVTSPEPASSELTSTQPSSSAPAEPDRLEVDGPTPAPAGPANPGTSKPAPGLAVPAVAIPALAVPAVAAPALAELSFGESSLATLQAAPRSRTRWMIAGGAALVGAVVVAVLVIGRSSPSRAPQPTVAKPTTAPAKPSSEASSNPSSEASGDPTSEAPGVPSTATAAAPPSLPDDPADIEIEEPSERDPASAQRSSGATPSASRSSASTTRTAADSASTSAPNRPQSKPALVEAPVAADGCDKVSCVIDGYARACCEVYRPRGPGELPRELDRAMITTAMAKAKAAVIRCGEEHPATGIVRLALVVRGDGGVDDAAVSEAPDAALGACVAAAVRRVTFAKTETGGSFAYPFKF